MQRDTIIFDLIEKEKKRQLHGLELIASENFVSDQVMEAAGSVLTNKYAEGYPGKRYYGGCEVVDEVEQLAIDRLKELFGAEYANVQPHSGSQANTAVFQACLKPGEKFLGFDLSHGGHLTHGSPVNFSGKLYEPVFYGVDKETGLIDYDKVAEIAEKEKPKMIIAGASAYSREIDYKRFREIADSIGAILFADIAHPAGLIAKGLISDPVPHCHIVTSTTHKTLRGPRGGIIIMGKDFDNPFGEKLKNGNLKKMSTLLNSAIFPGNQGGPLEHIIAAQLNRVQLGDYVAINAYVERTPSVHDSFQSIRTMIRDAKRVATTLGYGPRFLHSTGQLHKGGPNSGVFIQVTSDVAQDFAITGEPYSFGVLAAAQALGDMKSLNSRNRRVIRIHLGADVESGLSRVQAAIEGSLVAQKS